MGKRDRRRTGDRRPYAHTAGVPLNLHPAHEEPFRWLPRNGDASCIGEWLSQRFFLALAKWPVYWGVVLTLVVIALAVQVFVVQVIHPFGLG